MIEELGLCTLKLAVAEKMIRIIHVVSYWLAVLTATEQDVCWMTDHDEIAANVEIVGNMLRILARVMNGYLQRSGKSHTALPFAKTEEKYGLS